MRRSSFQFDEKITGLTLMLIGLLGLWRGWVAIAEKPSGSQSGVAQIASERVACKVLTVYDGDTLGCDLNHDGKIQKPKEQVRLLGIDSPEMHYSRKNPTYGSQHPKDEPFAKEASRWLTRQAEGKTVYLEFDRRQYDKYERTLAYVFSDRRAGQSFNARLLAQGYATLLFFGKNRRYESEFHTVELQARTAKKGLWASSGRW